MPHETSLLSESDRFSVISFCTQDGWTLRTAQWTHENAKGTIVLLQGRGDFIEKYSELMTDMHAAGFAVATLDWRGQGLSGQMTPPPRRTYIEDFDRWILDAQQWLASAEVQSLPHPRVLLAHSMGSHLGIRLLHAMPGFFARAVLLSPMLGLRTGPLPERSARAMTACALQLRQQYRFAPGQCAFDKIIPAIRYARLTSDPARFAHEQQAIAKNPGLAIGGVSFGWVAAAYRSLDVVRSPGYAETIQTPTLICLAGHEVLVDNKASRTFAQRLPYGQVIEIAGARHELFQERDTIRTPLIETIINFFSAP